ncbi:MAG: fimbiral protein pilA, partial [Deltaproteobacteria bacterium]
NASHEVCDAAKPVPNKVPKGVKYQPSSANNKDFNTGDTKTGWACLKFSINQPIYYRYTYVKGTKGLAAKKNKAKPNKDGFEAAAQGDLDGDGTRSTFALTGSVDTKTESLRLSTQLYVELEGE